MKVHLSTWLYQGASAWAYVELWMNDTYLGIFRMDEMSNNSTTPKDQDKNFSGTYKLK